jgi:prepilin-type N-terminal cleavage/methylation domain-containing protein
MSSISFRPVRGFTLIELLIVVAIIAILAAIAVPNFLEAQVRAKTSRVKSDMRATAIGIESYRVDNGTYPLGYWSNRGLSIPRTNIYSCGLEKISTPIAYLTSIREDVFKLPNFVTATGPVRWPFYGYHYDSTSPIVPGNPGTPPSRSAMHYLHARGVGWYMYSIGPAQLFTNAPMQVLTGTQTPGLPSLYDPTNGTASEGILMWSSIGDSTNGSLATDPSTIAPAPATW